MANRCCAVHSMSDAWFIEQRVRLVENWLTDPQKQRPDPSKNSVSLTVTPCIEVLIVTVS